jgi:hypothetical protein
MLANWNTPYEQLGIAYIGPGGVAGRWSRQRCWVDCPKALFSRMIVGPSASHGVVVATCSAGAGHRSEGELNPRCFSRCLE